MYSLAEMIRVVFRLFELALFARILMSWIPHDPMHPFANFLRQLTDWMLVPCRQLLDRFIPPGSMGIDFSPIMAFFALDIAQRVIIGLLQSLGTGF